MESGLAGLAAFAAIIIAASMFASKLTVGAAIPGKFLVSTWTQLQRVAAAIVITGMLVAVGGLLSIKQYRVEQFDRQRSKVDPLFGRDDMSNWLAVQERNSRRAVEAQESARVADPYIKWGSALCIGGMLLFALGGRTLGSPAKPDASPQ